VYSPLSFSLYQPTLCEHVFTHVLHFQSQYRGNGGWPGCIDKQKVLPFACLSLVVPIVLGTSLRVAPYSSSA